MKSPLRNLQPTFETVGPFISTVDLHQLNDELVYGYRIFRELITQYKKHVIAIEESDQDLREKDDKDVQNEISFEKINSNFNNGSYNGITEVVSDMRLGIQNCYRYYGYDHYVSKSARTLELIMEQKLALMPRLVRDKCTIASSNTHWNKEYLNQALYGSRRRSQPISESSETLLMMQLRTETEIMEREKRRLKEEARRIEYERLKKKLEVFESEVMTLQLLKEIKQSWELPCVGIYVYMLREFMNIPNLNYTEFELAAQLMDKSMLFRKIMTALLSTPSQRQRISFKRVLTYKEWTQELSTVVSKWYHMLEKEGDKYTCGLYGISSSFFQYLGNTNPLPSADLFTEFSMKKKLVIIKALCESVLENDEAMCSCLATIPILQRQDLYLGQDSDKNTYHFFPQFGSTDVRIYKQYRQSRSAIKSKGLSGNHPDYELVASNTEDLYNLISQFENRKKSKTSNMHALQETLEALYEELKSRADTFEKAHEKGKMAIMKDYYAEPEFSENDSTSATDSPLPTNGNDCKTIQMSARAKRLHERNQASTPHLIADDENSEASSQNAKTVGESDNKHTGDDRDHVLASEIEDISIEQDVAMTTVDCPIQLGQVCTGEENFEASSQNAKIVSESDDRDHVLASEAEDTFVEQDVAMTTVDCPPNQPDQVSTDYSFMSNPNLVND